MARAIELGRSVRLVTSPNPWVGCVVVSGGARYQGATSPPGGAHAETAALRAAGPDAAGATAYVTLEPCSHNGRTGPCADDLVAAGVSRVVVALEDPDPRVAGGGLDRLRAAGVRVDVGVLADHAATDLAPYLKHRRTGRPWVIVKLASTLDGRTAAADGSSRWITGADARADVHRLRAESDAVLVGAGTVRADDPALTVRDYPMPAEAAQPLRVVVGQAAADARIQPALSLSGPLPEMLDDLGARGVLQVLVEGGPTIAAAFHRAGLVDRYVLYLAPALTGGDDGAPLLAGAGAATIEQVWRGHLVSVERLGNDLRVELAPSVASQ